MSNGKAIIHVTFGLIKKTLCNMGQYFPKLYESFVGDINIKVTLSNYVTIKDQKKATGVDTFILAEKKLIFLKFIANILQ